jgi:Flp pilus assembly pilin Flp
VVDAFVLVVTSLRRLGRMDDHGVTSAEYALLAGLIVIVVSGAVAVFGQAVNNLFSQAAAAF